MLTIADARNATAEAINAGDAHHTQYDMDAIVKGVYEATGGYDIEAMDTAEFWALVEANDLTEQQIEVRTYAVTDTESQCIATESATRAILPLEDHVDLSATELGCEPGSAYRVLAVGPDSNVIDSLETTAD